jgi:hypothetical protein
LRLAPDAPENLQYFAQASTAAIGTLAYIAFETRRLYAEMEPRGQVFQPLPVTSLVKAEDFAAQQGGREGPAHCSGQVFDIEYSGLPPGEFECLRFVLDDMEWDGCLGFVEEGRDSLHVGCSSTARDFFAAIFQEAANVGTPVSVGAPGEECNTAGCGASRPVVRMPARGIRLASRWGRVPMETRLASATVAHRRAGSPNSGWAPVP